MKEVQAALRFRSELDISGKEAEDVSRKAKRMFSMTLTGGAISSFLFAYSKAKNENVKKLIEDYKKYKGMSEEEGRWGLIVAFLVKEALSNFKITGDLVDLMKRLSDRETRLKIERTMLRYLEALAKVLDAYS